MTTLREYLNGNEEYYYDGDIWGNYRGAMSREDVLECLDCLGIGNPELVEHPAISRSYSDYGYYLQSGNLHFVNRSTNECVLKAIR